MVFFDSVSINYITSKTIIPALKNVNLFINNGDHLGLVGESGSGKTTLALAIPRLLPNNAKIISGRILWYDTDILRASAKSLNQIRKNISIIFQNALACLNPLLPIGKQIADVLRYKAGKSVIVSKIRAIDLLAQLGFTNPEQLARKYPFELSGGMAQRVLIAMAIAAEPRLIIADEPTTGLDVIVQMEILHLWRDLLSQFKSALLLISHDIRVVIDLCEKIACMYHGEIVEKGVTQRIVSDPRHPYTAGLMQSFYGIQKRMFPFIPGVPTVSVQEQTCGFLPRCSFRTEKCLVEPPPYVQIEEGWEVKCWRPLGLQTCA